MGATVADAADTPRSEGPVIPRAWLWDWGVMLGLVLVMFWSVFQWMYDRWMAPDSYTSHGFLVPGVCGYFVYRMRGKLAVEPRRSSKWGLAILGASALLFVASGVLRVYFTAGFALLGFLTGMVVYWGGWGWLKRLWFPVVFLAFMLPLPEIAIARINLALKLFVTKVAVFGADMLGVPVVMDGATLHLEGGDLVVGDVCSGLRSLISLIAIGVLFAYCYKGRGTGGRGPGAGEQTRQVRIVQFALLAMTVPAAIVANMLRIFLNILFAHFYGNELLFRPLVGSIDIHWLSGILVFVFALLALHLTMLAAEKIVYDDEPEPTLIPQPPTPPIIPLSHAMPEEARS